MRCALLYQNSLLTQDERIFVAAVDYFPAYELVPTVKELLKTRGVSPLSLFRPRPVLLLLLPVPLQMIVLTHFSGDNASFLPDEKTQEKHDQYRDEFRRFVNTTEVMLQGCQVNPIENCVPWYWWLVP